MFQRRPLQGLASVPALTRATTGGLLLQKIFDNKIKPEFFVATQETRINKITASRLEYEQKHNSVAVGFAKTLIIKPNF